MALPAPSGPWSLIQSRNDFSQTVGRVISPSQGRYLHTGQLAYLIRSFTFTVSRLFFNFDHFTQTVGLLGRVISSSQGRYLNTGQHKHRINTFTYQISMPCVGFEPTIPASELRQPMS
jgi:hypothetical protein